MVCSECSLSYGQGCAYSGPKGTPMGVRILADFTFQARKFAGSRCLESLAKERCKVKDPLDGLETKMAEPGMP